MDQFTRDRILRQLSQAATRVPISGRNNSVGSVFASWYASFVSLDDAFYPLVNAFTAWIRSFNALHMGKLALPFPPAEAKSQKIIQLQVKFNHLVKTAYPKEISYLKQIYNAAQNISTLTAANVQHYQCQFAEHYAAAEKVIQHLRSITITIKQEMMQIEVKKVPEEEEEEEEEVLPSLFAKPSLPPSAPKLKIPAPPTSTDSKSPLTTTASPLLFFYEQNSKEHESLTNGNVYLLLNFLNDYFLPYIFYGLNLGEGLSSSSVKSKSTLLSVVFLPAAAP